MAFKNFNFMIFYFLIFLLLLLPYYSINGQNVEKTKLKNELLANLNKYSEGGSDLLEALGTPQGTDPPAPKEPLGTPPVPPPPSSSPRNHNGLLNLFQPQPSSIFGSLPNLFNGLLPLAFTTPPPPPQSFRPLGIQRLPFGAGPSQNQPPTFRQHPPPPPTTPPAQPFFTLPTLLPFFVQNGVPQDPSFQSQGPLRPLSSSIDSVATVRPRFINHTIPPSPSPMPGPMPTVKSMSEAVSDNIRDWRQRFYKAFKKLSGRGPFPSTTFPPQPPLKIHTLSPMSIPPPPPLPRPNTSNQMQPIIVFNETNIPQIPQRDHQLNRNGNRNDNWITNQKVKTYARDSKGRIVRLFGVESSGYRFNNSNTNGFIPVPDPPALLSQNVDIGPVYIPAARPSTSSPYYNSYPSTLPPPPIQQPMNYVAPMILPSPQPTPAVYTVQMPAPPSISPSAPPLAAYPGSTFDPLPLPPRDEQMTQEVDGLEYDNNNNESPNNDSPCDGCENTNLSPGGGNDQWFLGADNNNAIMENNEKCNSLRLRYIIQESIVNADAEASKRAIQLRAETELNSFYNVVCGTGFFSYIAHTDEFCQASSSGINCYVFSPVCSLRMESMGAGIARKKMRKRIRRRKSFVNKN